MIAKGAVRTFWFYVRECWSGNTEKGGGMNDLVGDAVWQGARERVSNRWS